MKIFFIIGSHLQALKSNLVVQFSVVCFGVMAAVAVISGIVLSHKIQTDAINNLMDEAVGSSSARVLEVLTPDDLSIPMYGERYDRFDQFVQTSIVSERTARIKIWAGDGTVIYSSDSTQVGERFPLKNNLLKALQGENSREIKTPDDPDNVLERHLGTLMAVNTPIVFPGETKPAGSFEIYQYYGPTAIRIESMRRWLFGGIALGFGVLYASLVLVVWNGWRTIKRQQSELATLNLELETSVKQRTEELEKTQERLLLSERMATFGELAGAVAHEIRSPLSGIKNGIFYIRRKQKNNDASEDAKKIQLFLDVMDEAVDNSDRIITSMIDFARMPTNELKESDIRQVVENSISGITMGDQIQINREFEKDMPTLYLDSSMVSKTLAALFENSKESMPDGGTLDITAEITNRRMVLRIRDDGHGIDSSELSKVFDPLFSTRNRGVGLGLPVARQVVRRHGGALDISSTPGVGTTVTLSFPISEPAVTIRTFMERRNAGLNLSAPETIGSSPLL